MDRIILALSQPETWYAIATGAGVFGVPVGYLLNMLARRLFGEDPGRHYEDGYRDGYLDARLSDAD